MNPLFQRAHNIMRWLVIGQLVLAVLCAIVSVLIIASSTGNPHNNPVGLALLGTVPGTVLGALLAGLTHWARRRLGRDADAGARFALGVNATIAVLALLTGLWPVAALHGWVALLISQALNLTNLPSENPPPFPAGDATSAAAPLAPGTRIERQVPGINQSTALLIASGFALAAVAVLVLCSRVGWNLGPIGLVPMFLLGGGVFYFSFVRRCPRCRRALRSRREKIAGTTRHRMLHDCPSCKVTWDAGVGGDRNYC